MTDPHPDWIIPDWPAPRHVRAFITTRAGGVSSGPFAGLNLGMRTGDDPGHVAANRKRLRASLPQAPRWLRQVHGTTVVQADGLAEAPEADAAIGLHPGTVCAVLAADCLPVLLTDDAGSFVAVAHAGWRGLAHGILEETLRRLPVPAAAAVAYLGPGIGRSAFEVGEEVREAFVKQDTEAATEFDPLPQGKWLADLAGLARRQLRRCGLLRVYGGQFCTYSSPPRFYSYRRDRITGRMAAVIWREE